VVRLTDQAVALLLLVPLILLQLALTIYPMAYSIWISFYDINLFKNQWEFAGGLQYAKAIGDSFVAESALNTIRFVGEVTVLVFVISVGVALLLNEDFLGKGVLRVLVIAPWAISEFATATIARYIYSSSYGFINSILFRLGLIDKYIDFLGSPFTMELMSLMYAWHFAPLGVFFILAGLQTIPQDLYKQAKVDGAGPIRRFFTITFPFIRYAILMTIVLATIESARTTDIIIVMTGGGPGTATTTLTYYIYKVFFRGLNLAYGAAISWLLMIGLIVAVTFYFILLTRRR
jgi:ABC-type sugar transport system permease subunit